MRFYDKILCFSLGWALEKEQLYGDYKVSDHCKHNNFKCETMSLLGDLLSRIKSRESPLIVCSSCLSCSRVTRVYRSVDGLICKSEKKMIKNCNTKLQFGNIPQQQNSTENYILRKLHFVSWNTFC